MVVNVHDSKFRNKCIKYKYLVVYEKLVTNFHRSKWERNVSPIWNYCNSEMNVTLHALYNFIEVQKLWKALCKWIKYILKIQWEINVKWLS